MCSAITDPLAVLVTGWLVTCISITVLLYRQEHSVVPQNKANSAMVCTYLGDDIHVFSGLLSFGDYICSVWLFACAAQSNLTAVPVKHAGFTGRCILVQTRDGVVPRQCN